MTSEQHPPTTAASDPTTPIRAVVADDHAAVRSGLVTLLSACPDIEVVGEAPDGPRAVQLARRLAPDVVVTDVRMPGAMGIDITPDLRASGARVLVVSAFDLDDYVVRALAAGADGYLVKSEDPANIVDAVRAVAAGDAVPSAATRAAVDALRRRAPNEGPAPAGLATPLTGREEDVLRLLAAGLSNQAIARELVVELTTVKTHVTHILAKIGVTSRVQAALWWNKRAPRA